LETLLRKLARGLYFLTLARIALQIVNRK